MHEVGKILNIENAFFRSYNNDFWYYSTVEHTTTMCCSISMHMNFSSTLLLILAGCGGLNLLLEPPTAWWPTVESDSMHLFSYEHLWVSKVCAKFVISKCVFALLQCKLLFKIQLFTNRCKNIFVQMHELWRFDKPIYFQKISYWKEVVWNIRLF